MRSGRIVACMMATILLMAPGIATADVVRPAFYELDASSAEAVQYELGRKLATELLVNATGLDAPTAALARQAAEQLALGKFLVAADAEADAQCAQVSALLLEMEVTSNSVGVTGLGNFSKYSGQCDGFRDAQKSHRRKRRPSLR